MDSWTKGKTFTNLGALGIQEPVILREPQIIKKNKWLALRFTTSNKLFFLSLPRWMNWLMGIPVWTCDYASGIVCKVRTQDRRPFIKSCTFPFLGFYSWDVTDRKINRDEELYWNRMPFSLSFVTLRTSEIHLFYNLQLFSGFISYFSSLSRSIPFIKIRLLKIGRMKLYFVLLMKSHFQSYPCPLQINSFWNLGFLLGITIILQIITGIFLGLHYTSDLKLIFFQF